jgi:uncharacterized protein YndB with AHSA1/START domain
VLALLLVLTAAPADVVKEVEVRASPGEVWKAWTTAEGARTFFAPDAKIEAKVGGAYELYFDPSAPAGKRGSEGCTVLAAEPLKKLQFSWNFPPAIPSLREAKALTTVTVELLPQGKTVKVRLTQTGWKDEPAWHDGKKYFESAWAVVLARLAHRFRRAPIDWKNAWAPVPAEAVAFLESDLGKVERDGSEWVLTVRDSHLVLDSIAIDRAVFVNEYGDAVSVEFVRSGDALDVTVKRAGGEEKHHFRRKDAGH